MKKTTLKKGFLLTAVSAAIIVAATPVMAGFEWRQPAPVQQKAPAPMPSDVIRWHEAAAVPVEKVESVEAAPVAASRASQAITKEETLPPPPAPESVAAPVQLTPPAPVVPRGDVVEVLSGFGRDIPLQVALQQIVPQDYAVSFAADVDQQQLVSWQGEKPWKQVMTDMLVSNSLGFTFDDKKISIARLTDAPATPTPVPQQVTEAPVPLTAAPEPAPVAVPASVVQDNVITWKEEPVVLPPTETPNEFYIAKEAPQPPSLPPVTIRREKPLIEEMFGDKPEGQKPAVAAADEPMPPLPAWQAKSGQTLREILTAWSKAAGVELQWSISYDYRMPDDIAYDGSFEQAAEKLFGQFVSLRPQPYGQIYRKDKGRVLVVMSHDISG